MAVDAGCPKALVETAVVDTEEPKAEGAPPSSKLSVHHHQTEQTVHCVRKMGTTDYRSTYHTYSVGYKIMIYVHLWNQTCHRKLHVTIHDANHDY